MRAGGLRRWLDRLYDASGTLAALALAGIAVVMLAQAAGRQVGLLLRGADDIAAWLCAASAFLGLAHTFRKGEMVRVALLLGRLPERQRWWAELASLAVMLAFVAYATWAVTRFVHESWATREINQGLLQWPIWIPQSSLVLGMGIFCIAVADELAQVLQRRKPAYQRAEEARNASAEFSEVLS